MPADARIRILWDSLFDLCHELGEDTDSQFGAGADWPELAEAESKLGFALPPELRASCHFSNGVRDAWKGHHFFSLEDIGKRLAQFRDELAAYPPFTCAPGARAPQLGATLIPFALGPNYTVYCIDLAPVPGGHAGQVCAVCFIDATVSVAAASYADFLAQGVAARQRSYDKKQAKGMLPSQEKQEGVLDVVIGLFALLAVAVIGLLTFLFALPRLIFGRKKAMPQEEAPAPVVRAPKVRRAAAPGSITALWYQIEDLNRAQGFDVDEQFLAGASADEIARYEQALGGPLPADLRELYTACGACAHPWLDEQHGFSGFDIRNLPLTFGILSSALDPKKPLTQEPGIGQLEPGPRLIPFGFGTIHRPFDVNSSDHLCCDLAPGSGGTPGQIIVLNLRKRTARILAPSLRAWLEEGVARLKEAG